MLSLTGLPPDEIIRHQGEQEDDLNNTVWTDPDEPDFTTALNDALSRVLDGGTVVVSSVAYSWDGTTVSVPEQDVTITSHAETQKGGGIDELYPVVDLGSNDGVVIDVSPVYQTGNNRGLSCFGDDTQTTATRFIESHVATAVRGCNAVNISDGRLCTLVTESGENVNGSKLLGVGARQVGRVVSLEDPGGTCLRGLNNRHSLLS